jgi:hypothetical protein
VPITELEWTQVAEHTVPPEIAQHCLEIAVAGKRQGLAPLIIAAVMKHECPTGDPKTTGFDGHGRGLMQIDDRYHPSFCSARFDGPQGTLLWQIPEFNVAYGARLLRKNLDYFQGDLWPSIAAYNAGRTRVKRALEAIGPKASQVERISAAESVCFHPDYVRRVKGLFETFHAALLTLERQRQERGRAS